jgi:hypothetical protein
MGLQDNNAIRTLPKKLWFPYKGRQYPIRVIRCLDVSQVVVVVLLPLLGMDYGGLLTSARHAHNLQNQQAITPVTESMRGDTKFAYPGQSPLHVKQPLSVPKKSPVCC